LSNFDYKKAINDLTEINIIPKVTSLPCLIYLDPPYYYNKGKVYKHSNIDFVEFKSYVDKLNNANYKVLISIDDCEFIRNLFKDYYIYSEE
jgi:DNA adenine methylase